MKTMNSHQIKLILVISIFISLLNIAQARNVAFCQDLDDHREILVQEPQIRNLQSFTNPHGLRIKFLQPPADPLVNSTQINHMFNIAALFFKQLLKVTDVTDSTRYASSYDCGYISSESEYGTIGFSFSQADMVISTQVEFNSSASYVAYASSCQVKSWVQYGYIGFNTYYFNTNPAETVQWQRYLLTLFHQTTHILGMSKNLFSYYRQSYLSPNYIPTCQSITKYGNRSLLTTPNVKAWAQKHYGCDQSSIGGLLQDQGGSGSAGSHWERTTTLDDYMAASAYTVRKVTQISLHMFKDTGFYYDVDFSLAENIQFGKNKGCDFARGLLNSSQASPQYCAANTTSTGFRRLLDFYNFFGGVCQKYSFSNDIQVVTPYSNYLCFDSSYSKYSLSKTNIFGSSSRSFHANSSQWQGVHCFEATCDSSKNNINIKLNGGASGVCTRGSSSIINIDGTQVYCPQNFDIFCSRENCPNHCGGDGYCSQGSCLSENLCSNIDSSCIRCKGNACTGCSSGLFPTGKNSPVCDTCENIISGCTNGCEVTQAGVTQCKQTKVVPPIIGICTKCIAVFDCKTCNIINNITNCLTCKNDENGNPKYPTIDQQSCKACSQVIMNCNMCTVQSGITVCKNCDKNLYPSTNGKSCKICSEVITNCSTCTVSSGVSVCSVCDSGYYPTSNGDSCRTCSQFIDNCTTCTVSTTGIAVCSVCDSGYYPTSNGDSCRTCSQFIDNCTICTVSSGIAACSVCDFGLEPINMGSECGIPSISCGIINCYTCNDPGTNFQVCTSCSNDPITNQNLYPTANGDSCQSCSQFIPNCTICSVTSGKAVCSECDNDLYPSIDGTTCKSCTQLIAQCTNCNKDGQSCSSCKKIHCLN